MNTLDSYRPEYNLKSDAYLGKKEDFNRKLEHLANTAQPEMWSFNETEPFKILDNYLNYTYDRIKQENKIAISRDKKAMCFNTGLQTRTYQNDIYAFFIENKDVNKSQWFFVGFNINSDPRLQCFDKLPEIADYFTNPTDFIFDRNLDIILDYEHIIDDNISRFTDIGFVDKHVIKALLENAVATVKNKLKRNYKIAIPQFYTDKARNNSKIQLLLPLFMRGISEQADLALVVDKTGNNYIGKTILTLEWAYINSRRIINPDVDWLKII